MDYTLSLTLGHQFYQTSPDGLQIIDTHTQANMHIPWLIVSQLYLYWRDTGPSTDTVTFDGYGMTFHPHATPGMRDTVSLVDPSGTTVILQARWFNALVPYWIDLHSRIRIETRFDQ